MPERDGTRSLALSFYPTDKFNNFSAPNFFSRRFTDFVAPKLRKKFGQALIFFPEKSPGRNFAVSNTPKYVN